MATQTHSSTVEASQRHYTLISLFLSLALLSFPLQVLIRTRSTPSTSASDPHYASSRAGAHWYSFAEKHEKEKQAQDEFTFYALYGLACTEPQCGLSIVKAHALYEEEFDESTRRPKPVEHYRQTKIPWFHNLVPRFRTWSTEELSLKSAESGVHYSFGFSYDSVLVNVPVYLQFLYDRFLERGGKVEIGELKHLHQAWHPSLSPSTEQPHVIVNCCGLGASKLTGVADPQIYPDRGQTIHIKCKEITQIWRAPSPTMATYILPRGDGTVILGGTHIQTWDTAVCEKTAEDIVRRCGKLVPLLRDSRNYEVIKHQVGLRPERHSRRIEIDPYYSHSRPQDHYTVGPTNRLVVHAYGHGGEGYQASWGTARKVVGLVWRERPELFLNGKTSDSLPYELKHGQVKTGLLEKAMGLEAPISKL